MNTELLFNTKKKGVLLVYPSFPIAHKSINHKDYFPIGLLKIGSYYTNELKNNKVKLVYGEQKKDEIVQQIGRPETVYVFSLFTYWSSYFYETLDYYIKTFPKAKFLVGGIYVSLMSEKVSKRLAKLYPTTNIVVHTGLVPEAEAANIKYGPAFELMPNIENIDYFIVHTKRGCHRRCSFCGTYKLENETCWDENVFTEYVKMITTKYKSLRKIVIYDNNFLKNDNASEILKRIIYFKEKRVISICESQSGFDGRLLNPQIAKMIKKAGFIYPKIAWDGKVIHSSDIQRQIQMLINAGYLSKEISVFMIYNWDISFAEMIKKLKTCLDMKVQITDCRYHPIDSDEADGYNPRLIWGQSSEDYYIHPKWTDWQIRLFRKLVRKGNIMTRMNWNNEQYNQWRLNEQIIKRTTGSGSDFVDKDIEEYKKEYKRHSKKLQQL